jgi:plasmid stabilization system protein ParE
LNDAARYFDLEGPGLGVAFLKEADRCIKSILKHPESGLVVTGVIRRRLLQGFPYAILYRIVPKQVRVLAVMNLKRRPMYWIGRE